MGFFRVGVAYVWGDTNGSFFSGERVGWYYIKKKKRGKGNPIVP